MDYIRSVRVVYSVLCQMDLSNPIPIEKLSEKTDYSPLTVKLAIKRLHQDGMIRLHRRANGLPYLYKLN